MRGDGQYGTPSGNILRRKGGRIGLRVANGKGNSEKFSQHSGYALLSV